MNLLKTTTIAFGGAAFAFMAASPAMAFQLGKTYGNASNRSITVNQNSDDGFGKDINTELGKTDSNQTGISSFSLNGAPDAMTYIIKEIAGFAPDNTFGIYEPGNTSNYSQLFGGSDTVGAFAYCLISTNQFKCLAGLFLPIVSYLTKLRIAID